MKTFLFLLILIPNLSFSQKEKIKYWSEKDTLQFEDFKGKHDNPKFGALSYLSLKLENIGITNDKINVMAIFNTKKSFIMAIHSNYVLKHEQIHFDITELFARKIRKELLVYYKNNFNLDIKVSYDIYKRQIKKYDLYEHEYDNETNYGRNIEQQSKWNRKIQKELEKYKEYSNDKYLKYIDSI